MHHLYCGHFSRSKKLKRNREIFILLFTLLTEINQFDIFNLKLFIITLILIAYWLVWNFLIMERKQCTIKNQILKNPSQIKISLETSEKNLQ
jgi:hypothetical protein